MYKIWLYPERYDSIKDLSLEDKWKILDNIFEFERSWQVLHNWYIGPIFNFMKIQFEYNKLLYEKRCEINQEVWKLWWRPKKNYDNLHKPNGIKNNPQKANTNTNTNININKESNINIYTQEKSFYEFVDNFIDPEIPQIKYQISKNNNYIESQYKTIDLLIKDWYTLEAIQTVLAYVKQDDFRSKQILSVKKLREKDKNWIPYIVRMIEKIQQWKPKVLDFDK